MSAFTRFKLAAAALAIAALAGACASAGPTPYQAAATGAHGFTETRIEADRYRIAFRGNTLTDRETVETYMLFRAAELTLQEGFDHFLIVNRDTDRKTRITSDFSPRYFHHAYFHPRYGFLSLYDPLWDDRSYREVTRFEATGEIVFGKGPKPSEPNAYDAREVSKNLAGKIQRPAQ